MDSGTVIALRCVTDNSTNNSASQVRVNNGGVRDGCVFQASRVPSVRSPSGEAEVRDGFASGQFTAATYSRGGCRGTIAITKQMSPS